MSDNTENTESVQAYTVEEMDEITRDIAVNGDLWGADPEDYEIDQQELEDAFRPAPAISPWDDPQEAAAYEAHLLNGYNCI